METKVIQNLEDLKKKGFNNMAVIELATMSWNNKNIDIDPLLFFSDKQRRDIAQTNKSGLEKMLQILSFGSNWSDDEYLLILTFIINYRLIMNYYIPYQLTLDIDDQVQLLEESVSSSIMSKENYKNAFRAASLIQKNRKKDLGEVFLKDIYNKMGINI